MRNLAVPPTTSASGLGAWHSKKRLALAWHSILDGREIFRRSVCMHGALAEHWRTRLTRPYRYRCLLMWLPV